MLTKLKEYDDIVRSLHKQLKDSKNRYDEYQQSWNSKANREIQLKKYKDQMEVLEEELYKKEQTLI